MIIIFIYPSLSPNLIFNLFSSDRKPFYTSIRVRPTILLSSAKAIIQARFVTNVPFTSIQESRIIFSTVKLNSTVVKPSSYLAHIYVVNSVVYCTVTINGHCHGLINFWRISNFFSIPYRTFQYMR